MKTFILIAVLAALTICYAASVPDEAARIRQNAPVYEAGSIGRQGEVIIHDQWYFRDTNGNNSVAFDIEYLGNVTTRVTGVRVYNPPAITNPGILGSSSITVRLVTAPGRELASWVVLYGRYV